MEDNVLVQIMEDYKKYLNLREVDVTGNSTTLYHKVTNSLQAFLNDASTGQLNSERIEGIVNEFAMLFVRLSYVIADLTGKKSIVLIPSKRNYLGLGRERLHSLLQDLTVYKNLSNVNKKDEIIKTLEEILTKAEYTEEALEFRILSNTFTLSNFTLTPLSLINHISRNQLYDLILLLNHSQV